MSEGNETQLVKLWIYNTYGAESPEQRLRTSSWGDVDQIPLQRLCVSIRRPSLGDAKRSGDHACYCHCRPGQLRVHGGSQCRDRGCASSVFEHCQSGGWWRMVQIPRCARRGRSPRSTCCLQLRRWSRHCGGLISRLGYIFEPVRSRIDGKNHT